MSLVLLFPIRIIFSFIFFYSSIKFTFITNMHLEPHHSKRSSNSNKFLSMHHWLASFAFTIFIGPPMHLFRFNLLCLFFCVCCWVISFSLDRFDDHYICWFIDQFTHSMHMKIINKQNIQHSSLPIANRTITEWLKRNLVCKQIQKLDQFSFKNSQNTNRYYVFCFFFARMSHAHHAHHFVMSDSGFVSHQR